MSEHTILRLFVTGHTERAREAIARVKRMGEEQLGGAYELQVIDVLEDPQTAEDDEIIATPTLVRVGGGPERRIVGDLTDMDLVALKLDLPPVGEGQERARSANRPPQGGLDAH